MLRGEFIRGDGLVIPNNITTAGAQQILASAFRDFNILAYMGLVAGAPDPGLQIESLIEPTIGVNGYARVMLGRGTAQWPTLGTLNGQNYIESKACVFTASGGNFDQAIRRMALLPASTVRFGDLWALSSPLPADLTITPTTPIDDRTFRYRVYLS